MLINYLNLLLLNYLLLPVNAFIIFNNLDDVEFKLLIDNVESVDKLFKLVKILVDVLFKLLIDNIDDDDKLFKLLLIPLIFKKL